MVVVVLRDPAGGRLEARGYIGKHAIGGRGVGGRKGGREGLLLWEEVVVVDGGLGW